MENSIRIKMFFAETKGGIIIYKIELNIKVVYKIVKLCRFLTKYIFCN